MNKQPTLEDFRMAQTPTIPEAAARHAKLTIIKRLHESDPSLSARQIAEKVYNGTIPDRTALMVSPENCETLNARLARRFEEFVASVERVIGEQGKEAV